MLQAGADDERRVVRVADDGPRRVLWKAVPAGDAEAAFAVERGARGDRHARLHRDAAEVRPHVVGALVTVDVRVGDVADRSHVGELRGEVRAELVAEYRDARRHVGNADRGRVESGVQL